MKELKKYRISNNNHVLVEFTISDKNNTLKLKITFYKGRYIEEENLFVYTSKKVFSSTVEDLDKETAAVIVSDTKPLNSKVRLFMKHKVKELTLSSDFKTYINKNKGDKDYEKLI